MLFANNFSHNTFFKNHIHEIEIVKKKIVLELKKDMMLQPEINHLVPGKINKTCLTLLKIILVCVCCVSLSLLIVILLVSNAWDICPGPVLLWQPPQAFSWPEPMSLVWPLWILLSLQYALQQKPSENFKEQDHSSQVLEHPQHASGPHCEVMGWERGRKKENLERLWGSAFVRVQGWGA